MSRARYHFAVTRTLLMTGSLAHAMATTPDPAQEVDEVRVLDLGPQHPSRTGLLLVRTESTDGVVTGARVQPGFNHRSVEKLFEVRDYRQALMLADRHDWHAAFSGELVLALACERLMGLVPPERATWLRTLLAEQARVASHLAHLSFVPHRTGDEVLARRVREARERGRELVLAISGNRVHPMMNRLGGLEHDVDAHWVDQIEQWGRECAGLAGEIQQGIDESGLGRGLGVLNAAQVEAFGLSGPVAAASGVQLDLRVRNPYLAYAELGEQLSTTGAPEWGDAAARLGHLAHEVRTSSALLTACARRLSRLDGPVDTKLSKIVKLPDASTYLAIAAPWGMAGVHLVSRAERTPWRLRLRTPSLANVQAAEVALVGAPLEVADVVLASLGWTAGDLDK